MYRSKFFEQEKKMMRDKNKEEKGRKIFFYVVLPIFELIIPLRDADYFFGDAGAGVLGCQPSSSSFSLVFLFSLVSYNFICSVTSKFKDGSAFFMHLIRPQGGAQLEISTMLPSGSQRKICVIPVKESGPPNR